MTNYILILLCYNNKYYILKMNNIKKIILLVKYFVTREKIFINDNNLNNILQLDLAHRVIHVTHIVV